MAPATPPAGFYRTGSGLRLDAQLLESAASQGKALALNRALDAVPEANLVAVYDADLAPHPGSLGSLAAVFQEPGLKALPA
jgi:cellulose synthase/poly-beta-1,6-N-acetylglucosamine synthase-like glycosyltransferase